MILKQRLEETLRSRIVSTGLEKNINCRAILVNSLPLVLLLTTYVYKNLVDVECITNPLM